MSSEAEARPGVPEHGLEYPNVEPGREARREATYVADAIVVGSGAGGAVSAALLAEAGLDVILLEEGALHRTESFSADVLKSLRLLYRDAGTSMILGKPGIIFAEGRCVGGSTVINGGMCWRTPDRILEQWSRERGLPATDPKAMEPWFALVERDMHPEPNRPETMGKHGVAFERGARALGWNPVWNLRNMRRCAGLNNCAFGCPTGAKQSVLVNFVPRALRAGAQLVTDAKVDRVLFEGRRAVGVRGRFLGANGRPTYRFSAHAPLVVVAGGAKHTIGILKRSWVRGRHLGRNLSTHPNAKVVGVFDEKLEAWRGAHQVHQIHQFLEEGLLIGYAMIPPGLLAGAMPGLGEKNAELLALYDHLFPAACLIEDRGTGRVLLGPDREPNMFYSLSDADLRLCHEGVAKTAELLFAGGARRVLLPFHDLPEVRSVDEIRRIRERPLRAKGVELMTVHIMGSARLGKDERHGATDAFGRVFGVEGLTVADACLFPSPIGVNPQETIQALAARCTAEWIDVDVARRRRRGLAKVAS